MSMIANINKAADGVPVAFGKLGTGGGLLFVAICAWFGPAYVASFAHRTLPPPQHWQAVPGGTARQIPATGSTSTNPTGGVASAPTTAPAQVPAPVPNTAPSVSVSPPAYRYVAPAPVPASPPPVMRTPAPPAPSFVPRGYSVMPINPRMSGPASGPVPFYRPMPMPFPRGMFGGGFPGGFGGGFGGGFHSFGGGRHR